MCGVGKIQSLKIHSQSLAQARSVIVFGCARVRIICLTLRVLTALVFFVHWLDCLFHWSCQPVVAGISFVSLYRDGWLNNGRRLKRAVTIFVASMICLRRFEKNVT